VKNALPPQRWYETNPVGFLVFSYGKWTKHILCDIVGYKPRGRREY
jgi:hypothetical protein